MGHLFFSSTLKLLTLGTLVLFDLNLLAQNYDVQILPIGKGNEQVFAGDYYKGKIYYCSNSKNKKAQHIQNEDKSRFLDLFSVEVNSEFKITGTPLRLPAEVNSALNEGPMFFSRINNKAYFSSNNIDSTNISLQLYEIEFNGNSWANKKNIVLELGLGNYSNPSISPDGKFLVFSFTAQDDTTSELYICTLEKGLWGDPKPIVDINSSYNETFPRWNGNQLFFSSDRPSKFGGLDLYQCSFNGRNFTDIKLLPSPINSFADDFLFIKIDAKKGIFSSNRTKGNDRIFGYELDLIKPEKFVETDINYCFTLQDETIQDPKQYEYVWEMGDGNKRHGTIIEYCYSDTGSYHVQCHLMNIESLDIERNIIEADIEISSDLPIINSSKNSESITINLDQSKSKKQFNQFYWILNNEPIFDQELKLSASEMKQIEIMVVLWNDFSPESVYGVKKTIRLVE